MDIKKIIGKRIKFLRRRKGWTQIDLADFVGTSKNNLSDIETGKHFPSLMLAYRLSFALCVDTRVLYKELLEKCADDHNLKCWELTKKYEEDLINIDSLEVFSYRDIVHEEKKS